jgi:hypothetical protein
MAMVILAVVALLQGSETPDYKHWASCKPGSWVRSRVVTKTPDYTLAQEATIRLLRIEKSAAIVEIVQRVYSEEDVLVSVQVSEKGIPARVDADLGVLKETEETLEIAERKLACRRSDVKREVGGVPYEMSFWLCPDVPGGTVKSQGGPAGEKAPSNLMVALEWKREGIDEVSTRAEAEKILKTVEDTLVGARTLRFEYARTYDGSPLKAPFAREGDRFAFTSTSERRNGVPLIHGGVCDGKTFLFSLNGAPVKRVAAKEGFGANAVAALLYGAPESMDSWGWVYEDLPVPSRAAISDARIRGKVDLGGTETILIEHLRDERLGFKRHVSVWVDARRFVPLKRFVLRAGSEPVFDGRLEETFSEFRLNEPIDPSIFTVPK